MGFSFALKDERCHDLRNAFDHMGDHLQDFHWQRFHDLIC